MIYLTIPYCGFDKSLKERRFRTVNAVATELMCKGEIVYSPVSHCHAIVSDNFLPDSWDYLDNMCKEFLINADKLVVVCVDGWKDSPEVQFEIEFAKEHNIPIEKKPLRG